MSWPVNQEMGFFPCAHVNIVFVNHSTWKMLYVIQRCPGLRYALTQSCKAVPGPSIARLSAVPTNILSYKDLLLSFFCRIHKASIYILSGPAKQLLHSLLVLWHDDMTLICLGELDLTRPDQLFNSSLIPDFKKASLANRYPEHYSPIINS